MGTLMRDYLFKPYEPDKPLLLPTDIRKWLPDDNLALFIGDVVDSLDLTAISEPCDHRHGGQPSHHPAMMLKLLFYGYCVGDRSSGELRGRPMKMWRFGFFAVTAARKRYDRPSSRLRRRHGERLNSQTRAIRSNAPPGLRRLCAR